jgi:DNA repair protein RadA/Sms
MYRCDACGYTTAKWLGRCPECASWGSLREQQAGGRKRGGRSAPAARPYTEIESAVERRLPTGIGELDRVLGGGLVPGAVVLLAGEPGIGKSTLLLQAASAVAVAGSGGRVLYLSGEESATQLKSRGERLGAGSERLLVSVESDVDRAIDEARNADIRLLAVDSVQAVRCADVGSVPGSVAQVRESAQRLVEFAKATEIPVILVGHVTKEGSIAGPRALEHVVDTVVHFEGDRQHEHRLLRVLKNRFGTVDELGVFRMTAGGLEGVVNASELFLTERDRDIPGTAVLAGIEGSRPLLVEVQALVGDPAQGSPRRTTLGVDASRVALVLAVLQRRCDLDLQARDVFVNVTGGLAVTEPAVDLAVAAAVATSALGRPLSRRWVVCGEIGLTGEVRAVSRLEARLREAERLGFTTAITPRRSPAAGGIRCLPVGEIEEAFGLLAG